ncbi:MAG: aryl-sulfate sulfotransferase [Bacteroidota bacterium]
MKLLRNTVIISLLLSLIIIGTSLHAQTFNRPLPPGVFPYEFVRNDSSAFGYYLLAPYKLNAQNTPGYIHGFPLLLDENGYVLWYRTVDSGNASNLAFHDQQQLYTFITTYSQTFSECVVMNSVFEPIDTFTVTNGVLPDAHEFTILANGNYALAGRKDSVMDLSAYTFAGIQGSAITHVRGFVLQEFNAQHQLVFQWNSNDHIFPTESFPAFYGYNAADFDYCHGNAISDDDDGNLLISFRHLNAVYKINHTTGAIIWRLGGKSSDFTFPNDYRFSGQHDIQKIANGNYTVFDNGNSHTPKRSRGIEYHLDTAVMTATRVWTYLNTPVVYSSAMGSHQTTADRNHLLSYGLVFRPDPSIQLVDDVGNLLTEINLADSVQTYRARLAMPAQPIPRPAVSCSTNLTDVFLSAPGGYQKYVWSTGDTTATIQITQTGVYQVWVNYGCGMVGSLPFFVDDITNVCGAAAIPENPFPAINEKYHFFDLLGRQVLPKRDGIYLQQDYSGKTKLRYIRSVEFSR